MLKYASAIFDYGLVMVRTSVKKYLPTGVGSTPENRNKPHIYIKNSKISISNE